MHSKCFEKEQSNINDLQYHPKRKPNKKFEKHKKIASEAKSINQKKMRWTEEQHKKYLGFITKRQNWFQDEEKKKNQKVFFKMALFIKSRNYTQCRSHHQKMVIKYKTINQIIKAPKKQNQEQTYQYSESIRKSQIKVNDQQQKQKQQNNLSDKQQQIISVPASQYEEQEEQQASIVNQKGLDFQNQSSIFNVLELNYKK